MEWMKQFEAVASHNPGLALVFAFVGGVLAGFTPCTYPMLPITVAFVGNRAQGSRFKGLILSSFYVLGIAIVYSILGLLAAYTGRLFGSMTMNPWVYVTVGNICLLGGLAMLEVFPLPVPAFLSRVQVQRISGHDLLGSVLVGGASALVISPCTTPILGVLLTLVATGKSVFWGGMMLFAFAYGMGSLVILVGTFTGLLASLPRSGLWMQRVQRVFAVLMLAVSEYFFIKAGEMWI